MTTLLSRGATWFREKLPAVARVTIDYRRGVEVLEGLEAVQGSSEVQSYTVEDADGTYKSIDWYIAAADLVFEGQVSEPRKGDEITRMNLAERTEVYVVLPIPGGREFESIDERIDHADRGRLLRVHSKFVRSE